MEAQKPLYLFAGGRGHDLMATLAGVRKLIKSLDKKKPVIAFVGAASMKDNWLIYAIISIFIKAGCNCSIQRVVLAPRNADLQKAKEILQKADAVFMSGGDVEIGMQILKEKEMVGFFQELARQGKLIFGVSAGSIMLCKSWVCWSDPQDDSTAQLFSCQGLAPLICDTHAEGDDWIELKSALLLEKEGVVGYGLTSGACLQVYPDGKLKAEYSPVLRFKRVNGKIERQPDLLPE
jgi:peptidase E